MFDSTLLERRQLARRFCAVGALVWLGACGGGGEAAHGPAAAAASPVATPEAPRIAAPGAPAGIACAPIDERAELVLGGPPTSTPRVYFGDAGVDAVVFWETADGGPINPSVMLLTGVGEVGCTRFGWYESRAGGITTARQISSQEFNGASVAGTRYVFGRAAAIDDLVGDWTNTTGLNATSMSVSADGRVQVNAFNTVLSGTLTPSASGNNVFRLRLDVAPLPWLNADFIGQAIVYEEADGGRMLAAWAESWSAADGAHFPIALVARRR